MKWFEPYYHLLALRRIRRYMPMDTARTIAFSIVGSRLDYCNSLLYGVNKESLIQLQRVQNNLARIVCDVRRGSTTEHRPAAGIALVAGVGSNRLQIGTAMLQRAEDKPA